MDFFDISFGTAFLAGFVTFFSPCIIPVLPGFFAFLGGQQAGRSEQKPATRWKIFGETFVFALGFSVVFILLGIGINFLGKPLAAQREVFERIGGVLLVLFGTMLLGIIPVHPIFNTNKLLKSVRFHSHMLQNFVFGAIFGFAWVPCIGPILGSVLFLATGEENATAGGILLLFFSIGLAIPFLIFSLFVPELSKVLRKISLFARYSRIIFGGILIVLGILLFFGKLAQYSGLLIQKMGTGLIF